MEPLYQLNIRQDTLTTLLEVHLLWTGKSGVQGSFWGLVQSSFWFLRLFTLWVGSHRHCSSVLQAGTPVHKTHNSAPLSSLSSLSNSICRHKRNVLLLRNVACNILAFASFCNLLSRTYFLTANIKFPACQHTNTSYTNKIAVIHLQFQNSKHKPNVN